MVTTNESMCKDFTNNIDAGVNMLSWFVVIPFTSCPAPPHFINNDNLNKNPHSKNPSNQKFVYNYLPEHHR